MAKHTIAIASFSLTAKLGALEIWTAKHEGRDINVQGQPVQDVIIDDEAGFTNAKGETVTFNRVENVPTIPSTRVRAMKGKIFMDAFGGVDAYKETLEAMKLEKDLNGY